MKTPKHSGKDAPAKTAPLNRSVGRGAASTFANPFLMARTISSLPAFILPIADLENLLAGAGKIIAPVSIDNVNAGVRYDSSIRLLEDLQQALSWTGGTTEKTAADCLCQVTFQLVERLNRLAERGALGDAPKRIRAWPINFAPGGSEGASRMKDEVALFEGLGVGREALITAGPRSRAGIAKKGKGGWRFETEAAITAAVLNAWWSLPLHKLRHASKPIRTAGYVYPKMRKRLQVHGFKTPGGRLLLWPWWMNDVLKLARTDPQTGLPFVERLGPTSLPLFMPVVEGLILWRVIFGKAARMMQSKVVDSDEGGDLDLGRFQPELMHRVLKGVRHTLRALAGKGRRGRKRKRSRK